MQNYSSRPVSLSPKSLNLTKNEIVELEDCIRSPESLLSVSFWDLEISFAVSTVPKNVDRNEQFYFIAYLSKGKDAAQAGHVFEDDVFIHKLLQPLLPWQ